jgi:hypothetical protein
VHYPENLARNHWYGAAHSHEVGEALLALDIAVDSGPLRSRKIINQLIEDRRGEHLLLGSAR